MLDVLKDYFAPVIGALGMFASYVAGRERTRHRISEVSADLAAVQADLKAMQIAQAAQNIQLATIITDLKWIKEKTEGRA